MAHNVVANQLALRENHYWPVDNATGGQTERQNVPPRAGIVLTVMICQITGKWHLMVQLNRHQSKKSKSLQMKARHSAFEVDRHGVVCAD